MRIALVILIAIQASWQTAAAETRLSYAAEKVEGRVLVWDGDRADWRALQPNELFVAGTLAQMAAGASVKARAIKRRGGLGVGAGFMITSPHPVITRLSPNNVKKVSMAGYYVDIDSSFFDQEANKVDEPEKETDENTALVRFRRAWERMVSYFNSQELTAKEGPLKMGTKSNMESPANAGDDVVEIDITYPKSGETIIVGSLPTTLAITWEEPEGVDANTLYKVYLWDATSGNPNVAGTTEETFYKLQINKSGNYYVRVETSDSRSRSSSTLFVVEVF